MNAWVAVAAKDLREEARGRETVVPILLVALLILSVGMLAFHDISDRAAVGAGVIWLSMAFATAVGLARAFGAEQDRGTLDALLALPMARGSVFLGKAASSFVVLMIVAGVATPAYFVASGETPGNVGSLALLLTFGAVGLAATGAMLSALAARTRARDVLLPVLLFPILVPLLLSGIHGTMIVLDGGSFSSWRPHFFVLAGFDVAFVAAAWLLFEEAVGE